MLLVLLVATLHRPVLTREIEQIKGWTVTLSRITPDQARALAELRAAQKSPAAHALLDAIDMQVDYDFLVERLGLR